MLGPSATSGSSGGSGSSASGSGGDGGGAADAAPGTPDGSPSGADGGQAELPGDIAAGAGTPLVAAHSMMRALFAAYDGKLFQVRRASDAKTQDIGPMGAGGNVDMTALSSFCSGTTCSVSILYDQTANANDLPQATPANQPTVMYWSTSVARNGPWRSR